MSYHDPYTSGKKVHLKLLRLAVLFVMILVTFFSFTMKKNTVASTDPLQEESAAASVQTASLQSSSVK